MPRPTASACCVTLMIASPGLDSDLREDVFAALERLVDCVGRLHAVLDDVGMGLAPELLGVALAPGRGERIVQRHGWVHHYLRDIWLQTRHFVAGPPRVVLHDLGDCWRPAAEAGLQI